MRASWGNRAHGLASAGSRRRYEARDLLFRPSVPAVTVETDSGCRWFAERSSPAFVRRAGGVLYYYLLLIWGFQGLAEAFSVGLAVLLENAPHDLTPIFISCHTKPAGVGSR